MSFLYITHDIAIARRFCQRIAVMYLGRVVELASAWQIIDQPRHPYTQALIGAIPTPVAATTANNNLCFHRLSANCTNNIANTK